MKHDFFNIGKLTILRISVAIIGVLYSILQVHIFGAKRDIEIYFIAQSLIYLIVSLSQSGQLGEIFIPEYHKQVKHGSQKLGDKVFSIVTNYIGITGILLSLMAYLAANLLTSLIAPGYTDQDRLLIASIFKFFCFAFPFQIVNSFIYSYLNARQIYGRAESIKIPKLVLSILFLYFLAPKYGVWALVVSYTIGIIFESIVLIFILKSSKACYAFLWKEKQFDHKAFILTIKNTLLYVISTQVYNVVFTASISFLPEGIYAIYKYTNQLFVAIRSAFIIPVLTIYKTNISNKIQNGDIKSIKQTIRTNMDLIFMVSVFTAATLISFKNKIIYILWYSEGFQNSELEIASSFIGWFSVSIILVGISGIFRGISVGYHKSRTLYFYNSFMQISSAIIVYVLILYFQTIGLKATIILNPALLGSVSVFIVYNRIKLRGITDVISIMKYVVICILILISQHFLNYIFTEEYFLQNKIVVTIQLFALTFISSCLYILYLFLLKTDISFELKKMAISVYKRII